MNNTPKPLSLKPGPAQSLLDTMSRGRESEKLSGKQKVRLNYTSGIIESAFRAVLEKNPQELIATLNEMEERSTPDMVNQYLVASIIAVSRSLLIASGDFTPKQEETP